MSPKQIIQQQIAEEIKLIPQEKQQELYELIRDFRADLEKSDSEASQIMKFAGSWSDIPEKDFDNFSTDIEKRRQNSLSRRSEF